MKRDEKEDTGGYQEIISDVGVDVGTIVDIATHWMGQLSL